jgi:hypothetical protein
MSETKKPQTVAEELSAMNEQLKTLFNSVQEIKDMLHGDGKTGLVSRVTALETRLDETRQQSKTGISWIAWIIATVIAAYAAFIKQSN